MTHTFSYKEKCEAANTAKQCPGHVLGFQPERQSTQRVTQLKYMAVSEVKPIERVLGSICLLPL